MTDTYEITLAVGVEDVIVTIEEPGPYTKLQLAAKSPSLPDKDTLEPGEFTPEMVEFCRIAIDNITDFPVSKLDDLSSDQFNRLLFSTMKVIAGNDPNNIDTDDYRVDTSQKTDVNATFDDLDLNDDGTVNREDWR